jgi:hypothetical protein
VPQEWLCLPFRVEEIQTTRLLMRSRLLHALLTLAALLVAWLVTSPAHASEPTAAAASEASIDAAFSASIVLHTPSGPPLSQLPQVPPAAPIGPATATSKAPLCDPRGAITFASAPQMQDVEVTLDTGLTLDDCFGADGGRGNDLNRAAPGRAPLPSDASSASSDAAVLRAAVVLAAPARELLPAPGPSTTCSRPGIRSTVDRPPRA